MPRARFYAAALCLLALLLLLATTPARAQEGEKEQPQAAAPDVAPTDEAPLATGGPDSFGYVYIDRNSPGGPNSRGLRWTNIATTGTELTFANRDDGTAAVALPFPFRFYGVSYTSITVCTNGYILMGVSTNCDALPHNGTGEPTNYVAGWWEDLDGRCAASQFDYQLVGTAPTRRAIIQYTNVGHYNQLCATGSLSTFQIILHESSNAIEVLHSGTVGTNGRTHYVEIGRSSSSPAPLTAYNGATAPGADWGVLFMPPPQNTSMENWVCRSPHLAIPDGTGSVNDTLTLTNPGNLGVTDVDVYLNLPHVFLGDVRATMTHVETGTSVPLFDRRCSDNDYIVAGIADDEAAGIPSTCYTFPAIALTGPFDPTTPLSAFDGESLGGSWRLTVQDLAGEDLGTLSQWCFKAETAPLAVELARFEATRQEDGVLVTWESISELDNLGYNLYRNSSDTAPGPRLNPELIPSQAAGSGQGALYEWLDADAVPENVYYYWLESVDVVGQTELYGPVASEPSQPTALTLGGVRTEPGHGGAGILVAPLALGLTLALAWRRRRQG